MYATFLFLLLLLLLVPAVALADPQMTPREWRKPIPLERVAVIASNVELSQKLVGAVKQSGAEVRAFTPAEAIIRGGLRWEQELLSHTVIVLGGIHTNRAMLPLYARYLCFGDADYPGYDGYVIRTIAYPFGTGTAAISLEASTPEGENAAVERFAALLSQSEGNQFPQTLEAHLPEHWSDKVRQQGPKGIRYALTGDPEQAKKGIDRLLASVDPRTGWFEYGDYGIERYVREYSLLQDAPGISESDLLKLDQGLLMTAMHSAKLWWRAKDGSRIGGRHQTMGTSCFTAAIELLRRRGNPNAEAKELLDQWWQESQDYWENACSAFHDDLDGIPSYYSPEPVLDWALIMGSEDHIRHQLPLAVLHAYSVIDNLGYYAGTGTYEECRPGNLFKTVPWGWLLEAANYFHPEKGYDWLMQNMPNTGINTWAVSRSVAGARAFGITDKHVFPDHLLGITTVPMGAYQYNKLPHDLDDARSSGRMYLPAPQDRCFQKLCFRDSFDPNGQYLALEGYQTSSADNLLPMDANCIIRYTDLGHIWLHSNSEKSGKLFRSAVFCTDGISDSIQPAGCELQAMHDGEDVGLVVSHFPNYVACDWTRNIIWLRGKYFVIVDLLQQNREGKFGLVCSFRTPQKAWLKQDGMILREGNAEAHIRNVDNVQLSLDGGDELEGAAIPTLLRETQFLDEGVGNVKVFRNLVYAVDPDHQGKLEARPIGETGVMIRGAIRGEDELALIAASPRGTGISIGLIKTNAQALYVSSVTWAQAGAEGIEVNGKLLQGNDGGSTDTIKAILEQLWVETQPVERPDAGIKKMKATAERVWSFDGFSNLPDAAPAPILTCEPEPQGILGSLLDGIVTRSSTVRWPSGEDVTLSLDLRENKAIHQIDFQTEQFGSQNTIPDPAAHPEPRAVIAEFSDDEFSADIRRRELIFTSDCTFEGLHKGVVYPIQRWMCQDIPEKARYVRLLFASQVWRGGLRMNELSVRPAGTNSARIIGHILRDVDGDGADDILAWSDQAELAIVCADDALLLKKRFPGYITSVECYDDLHPDGPRILVTTREARLYCLKPDGQEIWKTDFLESAEMNGDLPTGYSIGLMKKPDGSPLIVVGNYNLASFVSPQGEVLKYERLPAAYQTMTLSRGFDYNDDGKEDIVSTEVWGALSVLDADMRRRAGTRCPRGKGVIFEYWKPPTQEEAKAIVCSENGVGLLDLKKLDFDWMHNVKPINDCVVADIDGDGRQEVILAKQDGYLLIYSEAGKLIKSVLMGEQVRAVAIVSSDDGRQVVVAALPGRLVRLNPNLTEWATIAEGEYRRLAVLDEDNLLLAFRDGAVIDALRLSR
ncbi:hypothetical protein ACFL6S_06030 [Candidatus Poribacteria bacterium]